MNIPDNSDIVTVVIMTMLSAAARWADVMAGLGASIGLDKVGTEPFPGCDKTLNS